MGARQRTRTGAAIGLCQGGMGSGGSGLVLTWAKRVDGEDLTTISLCLFDEKMPNNWHWVMG